jgi:hypothetical protein
MAFGPNSPELDQWQNYFFATLSVDNEYSACNECVGCFIGKTYFSNATLTA